MGDRKKKQEQKEREQEKKKLMPFALFFAREPFAPPVVAPRGVCFSPRRPPLCVLLNTALALGAGKERGEDEEAPQSRLFLSDAVAFFLAAAAAVRPFRRTEKKLDRFSSSSSLLGLCRGLLHGPWHQTASPGLERSISFTE